MLNLKTKTMADVTYIPDSGSQTNSILPWVMANNGGMGGFNNAWPWLFAMNGGGFGGFGGWGGAGIGGGILGFLLGALVGNRGGLFGGGNGGGSQLGVELNNDSNTALIMQAITGTDANVRALAAQTNTDYAAMRDGICTLRSAIDQVAAQTGMSALQVQNAILSGDASIVAQLNQCCCDMKQITIAQGYENQIATLNQTNQLGGAISGSTQRTVDAIADLKSTMIEQFCGLEKRELQSTIAKQADTINQLRNSASNNVQTALFQNGFNVLNQKITELAGRIPNTVPVQWPNIQAVNTTPTVGVGGFGSGFPGLGWGFGAGVTF